MIGRESRFAYFPLTRVHRQDLHLRLRKVHRYLISSKNFLCFATTGDIVRHRGRDARRVYLMERKLILILSLNDGFKVSRKSTLRATWNVSPIMVFHINNGTRSISFMALIIFRRWRRIVNIAQQNISTVSRIILRRQHHTIEPAVYFVHFGIFWYILSQLSIANIAVYFVSSFPLPYRGIALVILHREIFR